MTASSTKTIRAFIAARPNEAAQAELVRVQRELKKTLAHSGLRIKWTDPDTFHITLLFLDDIPEESITGVISAMKSAGRVTSPAVCELAGLGLFKKSGAIWVGLNVSPALLEFQKELALALEMEPGRFHAHFTLGRSKAGGADQQFFQGLPALRELEGEKAEVEPVPFEINSIELVQSELTLEGPRYTILGSALLA